MIIGLGNASCWGWPDGERDAQTIYDAGIRWDRTNTENANSVGLSVARGFQSTTVIANTPNATPLTDASITEAGQATAATNALANNPNIFIAEFMNEPYYKGSKAWPVIYGRLYLAALTAVRNAGYTQPFLYCATGDFSMEQTTMSCTLSNGSAVATCASTENLTIYQAVTGNGTQASTAIASVDSKTQFTMNKTATLGGAQSLTFGTYWSHCADQGGGNAGGWLAKACYNVTGLAAAILANGIVLHPYGGVNEDSGGHCSGIAIVKWLASHFATVLGTCPPLYITEFGYKIDASHAFGEATGYYAHDELDQANKIRDALISLSSVPQVACASVYESHDDGWGVMYDDGTPKLALEVIGSFAKVGTEITVRESVSDDLSIVIVHADGHSDRWGPDEPDGRDIPDDLQFTTSMPGGDKDLTCSLSRDLSVYSDETLFDDVFVLLPGDDVAWNGYMSRFPRDGSSVKPTALGWINSLTWDTTAREIYCERELEKFGEMPQARVTALLNSYYPGGDSRIFWDSDTAQSTITLQITRLENWSVAPGIELIERWLDTQGIPLDSMYFAVSGYQIGAGWVVTAMLCSTSAGGLVDAVNVGSAGSTGQYLPAGGTNRIYAGIQFYYATTPYGPSDSVWRSNWTKLAVYGRHGLTKRGSDPGGFYPSDIINDIVGRWGTLLNKTYPGSIEQDTSFVLPSYAQYDPTHGYKMVGDVNAALLKDWGVYSGGEDNYPNRTFFLREPSASRLTWHARRSDGAVLTDEGIQADELVNGVIVRWTSFDGNNYSIGPSGSGANYTDASLVDTDPTNPVNSHNIGKKYGTITLSRKTTKDVALKVGAVWLARRLGVQRSGTLTVNGWVRHPSGYLAPACKMRAGDYAIVEDDPRDNVPRKIVNTTYTHRERSNKCDLEYGAARIDAILEAMGAQFEGMSVT